MKIPSIKSNNHNSNPSSADNSPVTSSSYADLIANMLSATPVEEPKPVLGETHKLSNRENTKVEKPIEDASDQQSKSVSNDAKPVVQDKDTAISSAEILHPNTAEANIVAENILLNTTKMNMLTDVQQANTANALEQVSDVKKPLEMDINKLVAAQQAATKAVATQQAGDVATSKVLQDVMPQTKIEGQLSAEQIIQDMYKDDDLNNKKINMTALEADIAAKLARNDNLITREPVKSARPTAEVATTSTATLTTTTSNPTSTPSPVMSQTTPMVLNQSIPAEHTKFLDTFNQLGNFIQQQLAHNNVNNNIAMNMPTAPKMPDEVLKSTPNQQYSFDVDLVAANVGPHLEGIYDAKIKIRPPELGEIIAQLKINKGSAELTLMTENNHVKQIVESNLPQLKQHFQQSNIDLTNVNIKSALDGDKGYQQAEQQANEKQRNNIIDPAGDISVSADNKKTAEKSSRSLIDTYA